MTERLAQLLHDEADLLDVPAPEPHSVLARGRGLRRRRRLAAGAAATAVLAVIGGAALVVDGVVGDGDGATLEPAAPPDSGAVFSIGTTVYLDDAHVAAPIDDTAIKSLYYTSAGVLVRHGDNNWSDGGGPQRFSIVRPDGTVDPIDVTTEETVHSTDPTQPYLAYAEETSGGIEVVVHDLRNDTEVARVPIDGPFAKNAWLPPPVGIVGDQVYVATSPTTYVVEWRTGTVSETDVIRPGTLPEINGGRQAISSEGQTSVVDITTGDTLLSVPGDTGYFDLSPDGRYARLVGDEFAPDAASRTSFDVYDVDTGAKVSIEGGSFDYGWTGAGDLFTVTEDELTTCAAATGVCTTVAHGITMPPPTEPQEVCEEFDGRRNCYTTVAQTWESTLRLGNRVFES